MITQTEILDLMQEFQACQKVLTSLGDEVRQHMIVQMLASNHSECQCSGMRVGDIAALTSLSRPAISHHLQILKNAGILKVRREGTKNFYYFDTDTSTLQNLIDMLEHTKNIMAVLPDRSGDDD